MSKEKETKNISSSTFYFFIFLLVASQSYVLFTLNKVIDGMNNHTEALHILDNRTNETPPILEDNPILDA